MKTSLDAEGGPDMARNVTIEMDEDFLADLRKVFGVETDEAAVKEAAMRLAKYVRRQDFIEDVRSGRIDLQYDVRDEPGEGSSAA
ncbi:hypothetical protein OG883_33595 [Streptomyces sp. NBC_01142]|uniref:hypothetical protein n=1 Tax=Streptomyces sp. NBC_01142 TaxID=2975865 RepID=UPI0022599F39|nr:hypothetical protein [Streptomyces sp. NBC_01142]MCX4824706.1 hypothetical protein [Streptomyces sp. NBC_01142]